MHAFQGLGQGMMVQFESSALLGQSEFRGPVFEPLVIQVVEKADTFLPFQGPALKFGQGAPGIKEVAAYMRPTKGQLNYQNIEPLAK